MPREGGPLAVMLAEHDDERKLLARTLQGGRKTVFEWSRE